MLRVQQTEVILVCILVARPYLSSSGSFFNLNFPTLKKSTIIRKYEKKTRVPSLLF